MNPKTYENEVDQLVSIKEDIKKTNDEFKDLHKIFKDVFNFDPREFNIVAKARYYKDGVPNPDAVSKLHRFLDQFAILVHWYRFLEDDEIIDYLKVKGITLDSNKVLFDTLLNNDVIDPKKWEDAMGDQTLGIPDRTSEVAKALYDRSEELFNKLHKSKDTYDVLVDTTSTNEKIKKPHISKAVNIRYKQKQNKPIEGEISKVRENNASSEASISIFDVQ
jgi:hypothetical protein